MRKELNINFENNGLLATLAVVNFSMCSGVQGSRVAKVTWHGTP